MYLIICIPQSYFLYKRNTLQIKFELALAERELIQYKMASALFTHLTNCIFYMKF